MSYEVRDQINQMMAEGDFSFKGEPNTVREAFNAMFAEAPLLDSVHMREDTLAGLPGIWFTSPDADANYAILYLHGGGYVVGNANAYAATVGRLADAASIPVFAPDYPLSPENPFPVACDAIMACYRALVLQGKKVVVAGDSAGGGLVMSLLIEAKANRDTLPACAVLWSPWLDLSAEAPSHTANASLDPVLSTDDLKYCARQYVGESIPQDARVRPLEQDLSGLPPLLIQVGSAEVLLDDATRLAALAIRHHVHAQLDVYPKFSHVFQSFAFMLEEGAHAIEDSARFITRHL